MNNNRSSLPYYLLESSRDNQERRTQSVFGDFHNLRPVMETNQSGDNHIQLSQWLQGQPGIASIEQPENTSDVAINMESAAEPRIAQESSPDQQQPQQPQPSENPSPMALITQFLEQNPEINSFVRSSLAYIPFFVVVWLKELYEHTSGLFVILGLIGTFVHANNTVKKQVYRQGKRELGRLAIITFNIIFCILFANFLSGFENPYQSLLLLPSTTSPMLLTTLLWSVIITDYVIKLGTVLLKAGIAAASPYLFSLTSRGKYFVFIEMTSHVYRSLVPIPPWTNYLYHAQTGQQNSNATNTSAVVFFRTGIGLAFCAIYFISKAYHAIGLLKNWKASFCKLFQSTMYGGSPSDAQLLASGSICAICHDDYRKPTLLNCKHIFCEECLAVWLDRERTCPMCRATVAADPEWRDGSTAHYVQLF